MGTDGEMKLLAMLDAKGGRGATSGKGLKHPHPPSFAHTQPPTHWLVPRLHPDYESIDELGVSAINPFGLF